MEILLSQELNNLSDESRIWIYQANRAIEASHVDGVNNALQKFATGWTSHNQQLKAHAELYFNRFIVVFLDQSASTQASGCSIDKLVHFMEGLGHELRVDLMDRMLFYFKKNEEIVPIHMNNLSDEFRSNSITPDTPVFDSLVKTKKEWTESWLKPLKDSWHYRFV